MKDGRPSPLNRRRPFYNHRKTNGRLYLNERTNQPKRTDISCKIRSCFYARWKQLKTNKKALFHPEQSPFSATIQVSALFLPIEIIECPAIHPFDDRNFVPELNR